MSLHVIDPAELISPLGEASPSGPNLEYDPEFPALERAQHGKPEQSIGDSIKPAEEPDWHDVGERAVALLKRTRDLRVAIVLAQAQLATDGISGFAASLTVINTLLESQWETIHPQLDADDDNDPTLRINTLLSLTSPDGVRKSLREVPVVRSPALGKFSLRDFRIASGKLVAPANMADPPEQARIDAAFQDAKLEPLKADFEQLKAALEHMSGIERLLAEKLGDQAPALTPLLEDLEEIRHIMSEKLAMRGVGITIAADDGAAGSQGLPSQKALPGAGRGEISSRDDVIMQLDRLCDYYRRYEPSSPIPILLRRAKRLVKKDFMEIVRDLTPGGLAELETLAGVEKTDG